MLLSTGWLRLPPSRSEPQISLPRAVSYLVVGAFDAPVRSPGYCNTIPAFMDEGSDAIALHNCVTKTHSHWSRALTDPNARCILPRSMIRRLAHYRNIVAILWVVAIPFCCCNLRTLLAGDMARRAASYSDDGPVLAMTSPTEDQGPRARSCCQDNSATKSGASHSGPQNDPSDQQRDCSCDKSGGKMLSVEKSALELPAQVVVAALEWAPRPELRHPDPVRGHVEFPPADHRSLTSLVRMHCALIV